MMNLKHESPRRAAVQKSVEEAQAKRIAVEATIRERKLIQAINEAVKTVTA